MILRDKEICELSILRKEWVFSLLCLEKVLGFFCSTVGLLALDFEFWLLLIEFHELGEIELGFLEQLDLADENVLEGEYLLALLDDLFAERISNAIYNIINYWLTPTKVLLKQATL